MSLELARTECGITVNISPEGYHRFLAGYDKWSRHVDEILYELCVKHPHHADHGGVAAKCWIIGRTYATGIERQITSGGKQGDSMSQLVDMLVDQADHVDSLIDHLCPLRHPLTAESLATIIHVHGRFVHLLSGIVRPNETPRAFASKYLHFHCPLVPVYDSVVAKVIPRLVPWHNGLIVFPKPTAAEDKYAWFCYRFWNLYQEARAEVDDHLSVKLLDYYLLSLGGSPEEP